MAEAHDPLAALERLLHPALGVAHLGDLLEHRLDVRRRAAVQRAGERADGGGERGAAVGARRRHDAGGEGRCVEAVLRGADPVRVDRLDVPRIGLAAPAEEELLGGGPALRDHLVRDDAGLAVGHPRGPRDDGHHLGGDPAEVDPGLLVGDLVELAELPLAGEACRLGLEVGRPVAGQERRLVGLRLGHGRRQVVVDEEAPDVLVRELPDELLDVDPAVAERAAVPVGLGDLRLDGDDALEARLELAHPTPSRRGRSFRPDGT